MPNEKYIWSLAVFNDGSLAVGTGENGKIYRVKSANAAPSDSLFFDTSETHIISMAIDKTGNLYAGTDASGLVLRFSPDGRPFALIDSPLREIHALAVGADNSVYALALGESIATAVAPPTASADSNSTVAGDGVTITQPAKSRYDLTGAKTVVYRILPDGGANVIYNSSSIIGFSLVAQTGGVLIGTSDKGRIYSVAMTGAKGSLHRPIKIRFLLCCKLDRIFTRRQAIRENYFASVRRHKLAARAKTIWKENMRRRF